MNILLLLTFIASAFAIEQDSTITTATFTVIGVYMLIVIIACVIIVFIQKRNKQGEYAPLNPH